MQQQSRIAGPRISRETRLLLTTALLALAILWVLARIRFPDSPVTANPVPPVLTQLGATPRFEDLAGEVSQVHGRLQPLMHVISARAAGATVSMAAVALSIGDGVAAAWLPPDAPADAISDAEIVAHDPASGLLVLLRPGEGDAPMPVPWVPRRLDQARFLISSDVAAQSVTLRPFFVGALTAVDNAAWPDPIWVLPERSETAPGAFVFTTNGELAGLVVGHADATALVPAETLLKEVDRLLNSGRQQVGHLGVQVEPLTADLGRATGAAAGVVVVWVEEGSAADGVLMIGDVIEAIDSQPVATAQHWNARTRRVAAAEILSLRVRRAGEARDMQIVARPRPAAAATDALGLTLRQTPDLGAEILRVDAGSAAARAGLAAGDVITFIGRAGAPTPAQVRAAFASAAEGQPVMVAFRRGDTAGVTTLQK